MRILMIAPQPFFEARGAPFCVYQHIKALVTLGYEVDLVTYHIGQDVTLPGLRLVRAPALPFLHNVKPGPSLAKGPLDILVFLTAFWRLCVRHYTFIHTHEEAGAMGVILAWLFPCKHLYYMHSDLSQVVTSSEFTKNRLLLRCVESVQKFMVRKSHAVIAFYPAIASSARQLAPQTPVYLIVPPAVDEGLPEASTEEAAKLRQQLNLGDGPVLLYTGTLEQYQGIDMLLQSVSAICEECPSARLVIAGGRPDQVEKLRVLAKELGVFELVRIVGQRSVEEMPRYMALAAILLSPRSSGTHTPLKLYTYLRAGKPILATSILSHTQILTSDMAKLVPPTPEGLAQGALELLRDPEHARALGSYGQQYAQEHYSWPVFLQKNQQVYNEFMSTSRLEQPETIQRQHAGRR